jgi:hypothetical protein
MFFFKDKKRLFPKKQEILTISLILLRSDTWNLKAKSEVDPDATI